MTDFDETLEEALGEEIESEADPVGEYLGERNKFGERHGKGWTILPNGDQYDGEYRKGRRHGKGLYVFKDGSRYLGTYRCAVRSGPGMFIYLDGTVYDGNWHRNKKHGKGTYTYANGDKYSGDWYKGKRHGVGKYIWKDQGVYFEGTWRDGVRVGPCTVHYGKLKFHGCWDYKYPQGPGVFSFDKKHILRGYYRPDTLFAQPSEKRDDFEAGEDENGTLGEEEGDSSIDLEVKPSKWVSQDMHDFDFSLLPQHPVPLPISDSEVSICDLNSVDIVQGPVIDAARPSVGEQMEEEAKGEEAIEEGESESDNGCDFDFANKGI